MKFFVVCLTSCLLLLLFGQQLSADPIVDHRQGKNGRAEYVHAIFVPSDLNTGEPTSKNQALAKQIRALGKEGDDCGHIVANVLGGPMKAYNLFPQNSNKNRGEWKSTVEGHLQKFLELEKENKNANYKIDYVVNLVYAKDTDTRPTQVRFQVKFYKDSKLVLFTDIPMNGKHRVPSNPYVGVVLNP